MSELKQNKRVKQYVWNPTLELVGYVLQETKRTIHNKGKRVGKVEGRLDVIHIDERVNIYHDQSKFVKIFIDAGALEEYNELSRGGQRVLTSFINNLNYNEDWIYYVPFNVSKEANIPESKLSVYINELLEKEWIFRSKEKGKFWINLCYVCIGDRDELYRKYLKMIKLHYRI